MGVPVHGKNLIQGGDDATTFVSLPVATIYFLSRVSLETLESVQCEYHEYHALTNYVDEVGGRRNAVDVDLDALLDQDLL